MFIHRILTGCCIWVSVVYEDWISLVILGQFTISSSKKPLHGFYAYVISYTREYIKWMDWICRYHNSTASTHTHERKSYSIQTFTETSSRIWTRALRFTQARADHSTGHWRNDSELVLKRTWPSVPYEPRQEAVTIGASATLEDGIWQSV